MFEVSVCIFLLALLMALGITPVVKLVARKLNIVDPPNERKIHKSPIPRLGGISIFLSILTVSFVYFVYGAKHIPDNHASTGVFMAILAGGALMLLLGLVDDVFKVRASRKLFFQIVIASVVYLLGFRIEFVRFFDGVQFDLGLFSYFFTVMWIVGITNAVNLIDGMDGLASGLSFVAFIFVAVVAMLYGNYHVAVISFGMCGALLGFMRYNFHPASIFMGDSGSLFLGYLLAIFSVQAMRNGHLQFSLLVSCFILAVPILDTLLAIVRRFTKYYIRNGNGDKSVVETVKKILYPDKGHIHHKLLLKGLTQRQVSMNMYIMSVVGGSVAIMFNFLSSHAIILLMTCVALSVIKLVDYLAYEDFASQRRFIHSSE